MSDPIITSTRALRMIANMRDDAIDGLPGTKRRALMTLYREMVFIFGSLGTLTPALLLVALSGFLIVEAGGLLFYVVFMLMKHMGG
ncbi:MAG: hypothetical protein Q8Q28_03390 [Pseudomonadota bacterium]|nr:hypothetical protein [Pseudomonadota bacterium]